MKTKIRTILIFILMSVCAGASFAALGAFSFPKDETVVFENRSAGGKMAKVTNTYYRSGSNFVVKINEENGDITKIVVDKNFIPSSYQKMSRLGKIVEYAVYNNGKLSVSIPSRNMKKEVKLPSSYYDSYTLFYVFRTFPFDKKDTITINLAYHDPGNTRVVKMAVKNKGTETVKIGAGKFKCYKLELGTVNPAEVAIWPYKYYFWFSTDPNRYFVKFQGREKDASSIVSELNTYKVGKKFVVKKSASNTSKTDYASFPLTD